MSQSSSLCVEKAKEGLPTDSALQSFVTIAVPMKLVLDLDVIG